MFSRQNFLHRLMDVVKHEAGKKAFKHLIDKQEKILLAASRSLQHWRLWVANAINYECLLCLPFFVNQNVARCEDLSLRNGILAELSSLIRYSSPRGGKKGAWDAFIYFLITRHDGERKRKIKANKRKKTFILSSFHHRRSFRRSCFRLKFSKRRVRR